MCVTIIATDITIDPASNLRILASNNLLTLRIPQSNIPLKALNLSDIDNEKPISWCTDGRLSFEASSTTQLPQCPENFFRSSAHVCTSSDKRGRSVSQHCCLPNYSIFKPLFYRAVRYKHLFFLLLSTFWTHFHILRLATGGVNHCANRPFSMKYYRRVPVRHGDYLSIIKGASSDEVADFLIIPNSQSHWKKIDDFEGVGNSRHCVQICLTQSDTTVATDANLLAGDLKMLEEGWSFCYLKGEGLARVVSRLANVGASSLPQLGLDG